MEFADAGRFLTRWAICCAQAYNQRRSWRCYDLRNKAQESQVFQSTYQDALATPARGPRHGPYSVPDDFVRIVVSASVGVHPASGKIGLSRQHRVFLDAECGKSARSSR